MAGPKVLDRQFRFWIQRDSALTAAQVIAAYESGFAGAYQEPLEKEQALDWVARNGGAIDSDTAFGAFAGSAVGKLSVPFVHAIDALGANPWPGAAQQRGDCTTHGDKNANLVSWGCEVALAAPDEETGKIEGIPDLTERGIVQGAFAPEASWWVRTVEDGGGDGWSCWAAARASCEKIGLWPRASFPELQIDLTAYSNANTRLFRSSIPEAVRTFGLRHRMRTMTEVKGWEAGGDALANGYGVNSCGSQAWSSVRDENGFSPTKFGGWSHSEAYIACDWRPWVAKKYNVPALLCQMNSWSKWNSGPRDIYDSAQFVPASKRERWIKLGLVNPSTGNLMIPEGSRWVACTTLNSRSLIAKASVAGWPARKLPTYGMGIWG